MNTHMAGFELDVVWAKKNGGDGQAHCFPDGGRSSLCSGNVRKTEKNWTVITGERGVVCFKCAAKLRAVQNGTALFGASIF